MPANTNARTELQEFLDLVISNTRHLRCADIAFDIWQLRDNSEKKFLLLEEYTQEQFEQWLASLDFEYDAGFGGQMLYGTLWFTDGSWGSRGEYDGSEWWVLNIYPVIPDELRIPKPNYKEVAEKFVSSLNFERVAGFVHDEDEQAKEEAKKESDEFLKEFSVMLERLSKRNEDEKDDNTLG
jgi:hypothetical protein